MKRKFVFLLVGTFHLIFSSCGDTIGPPITGDGIISGKITIGEYNRKPKSAVMIKLRKVVNNTYSLIDSVYTEHSRYQFENLPDGLYAVCFKQDYRYTPFRNWQPNDGICHTHEIMSSSKIDSLDFHLYAWHHFSHDSIIIEADSSNWNSISVNPLFYNDGVRDTINWNFRPNSIPYWLGVEPTSGIYEPEAQSDKRLTITIHKHNFPRTLWNKSFQLEIFSQYAVHILTIAFKVV